VIRLHGEYEFWQGSRLVYRFSNIVCTPVYEYILKGLTGESAPDVDVTYFAFGIGTGAVAESDTTLGTEVFRKQVTSKGWNGKQFVAICQLANNEANYSLKEVGIFAGGTVAADSGTLLSHALKDIEKNSNITYNVIYRLNLEEV